MSAAVVWAFACYLALMLAVGGYAWRRVRDQSDFILGGRRLGRWTAALSAGASDMSGWLLLGLPGYAYAAGLESLWLAGGLLLGTWLNWRLVACRLRIYSAALDDALTLPEYFERRFGARGRLLRTTAALFIVLFFLFYAASGLVAGGKLFATAFDLPYRLAVGVGAVIILGYTLFGGFLAVSWTDVVQALLMALALVSVPVLAAARTLSAAQPVVPVGFFNPLTDAQGMPLSVAAAASLAAWGLGYFGQPHILARFKAVRSAAQLPRARMIAVTWTAWCLVGATAVGMTGALTVQPPLSGPDTETVFMVLVQWLVHPVVAGLLLAAILAAIMSTADSQLLVASAALSEDLYRGWLRPAASPTELLSMSRAAVLGVGLAATWLAWDPDRRVLDLVAYAWAGFGAAFGPPLLLSLYWERMNVHGALAGMVTGAATVVVWRAWIAQASGIYELLPGFALSLGATLVVSLLTARPDEAVRRRHQRLGVDGWGRNL